MNSQLLIRNYFMVLCWRTEIHVQFTNYKVQAGLANERLRSWWGCELMKSGKNTTVLKPKSVIRLYGNSISSVCLWLFFHNGIAIDAKCSAALHFSAVRHYTFAQCGTIQLCSAALHFAWIMMRLWTKSGLLLDKYLYNNKDNGLRSQILPPKVVRMTDTVCFFFLDIST